MPVITLHLIFVLHVQLTLLVFILIVGLDAVSLPPGVRAYLDACLAGVGAEPRPEWGVRFVP